MTAEESTTKPDHIIIKPVETDLIEILTFTIYSIIIFCIVTFQLNIPQQYNMNNNIQQLFFYKATNIFKEPYIGTLQTFNWINGQLYNGYNFGGHNDQKSSSVPVPFTYLRIRQKMASINSATGYLNTKGEEFKQDVGNRNQFSYDQDLGAYAQFYIPMSVKADIQDDVRTTDIFNGDLDLITTGYLNKQTMQVLIDTMYYSANLQMIAVVQIEFKFTGGLISKSFSVISFPSGSYKTQSDQIRFAFEIIFMIMYAYYFIMEGLKIKHQIDQCFLADERAEEKLKRSKLIKEKLNRQENYQRKAIIEIKINEESPFRLQRNSFKFKKAFTNTIVNKASLYKKRFKNILLGLSRHLKEIWSFADVILIILIGVAGVDWIDLQINQQAIWQLEKILKKVDNYDGIFQKTNVEQDIKMINDMMILHAYTINKYRRCVSGILLITSMKLLRYSTHLFPTLKKYVDIMVKVSEYLIFYMILIFCIMMGAGYFIYFQFGSDIDKISDPLKSVQYIITMVMGFNDIQQDMLNYDKTSTIIFSIILYFVVGCLLHNMFFVFVNQELDVSQKKKQHKSINKDQSMLTQKHLYWVILDIVERIAITCWYTITLRKRDDISKYFGDKALEEHVHKRNFLKNIQIIPYNTNFDGDDCSDEEDQHNSQPKKTSKNIVLGAEQIQIQMHTAKEEFVALTWYTISLLVLLCFSIIIVQIFAKTEDGRQLSNSIEKKIMNTQAEGNISFANIHTQTDISQWLIEGFPLLFDDILLGKREVEFLYKKPDPIVQQDGISEQDNLIQDSYKFDNLKYASSISYFNFVVNNMCRINIRKSLNGPNPDDSLRILQDTIKLMELSDPGDIAPDGTEMTETYTHTISGTPSLVLEYDSKGGKGQVGGYQMVLDIQQVDELMYQLDGIEFFGDDLVTFSLQFLTFNPINLRSFASVFIDLTVSNSGLVVGKKIYVDSIYKNSLSTQNETTMIIFSLLLLIMMFYYYGHILMQMRVKYLAYDRWQKMFVKGMMNDSQIWFRQRNKPEFIRKAQYLIDPSQIINSLFLMLNSAQISLLLYSFFITNDLTQGINLFQMRIQEFLNIASLSIEPVRSDEEILLLIDKITKNNRDTIMITSFALPLLCLNILFVQLKTRESMQILLTFNECMNHFPYLIIIMFEFIIGFTITGHFLFGDQILNFKSFFSSLIEIFNYILRIKNMEFFQNDIVGMLMILVPFIFIVRFILFNLFLAITYRSYLSSQHRMSKMRKPQFQMSVSIMDFILITKQMLSFQVKLPNPNSELYLKQLIQTFEPNSANKQFKDVVRTTLVQARVNNWADSLAEVIKLEVDITLPLKMTVNNLIQSYVKYNKDGNEGILEKIDSERKYYDFNLFYTYLNYLKTSHQQMEKLISFFETRSHDFKRYLYRHIDTIRSNNENQKDDEGYQVQYISELEARLEEALQGMNFLRLEFETIGLHSTKIQFDDSTVQKTEAPEPAIKKSLTKDRSNRIKNFKDQNNLAPIQTKDQKKQISRQASKSSEPEEQKEMGSKDKFKENPKSSLRSNIKATDRKKMVSIQFQEDNE